MTAKFNFQLSAIARWEIFNPMVTTWRMFWKQVTTSWDAFYPCFKVLVENTNAPKLCEIQEVVGKKRSRRRDGKCKTGFPIITLRPSEERNI